MSRVSIEQLLEAGAHFGHLTRRWNPQMRNFIFAERNGIHVIDLRKTQLLIDVAYDAVVELASRGGRFMFVGTKKQAKDVIAREAARCGAYYASDRWLGGMLTNFATIRKSIRRMEAIEKMETDGTFDKLKKKERLILLREKDRLHRVLGGIRDMSRLPSAMFIVDIKKEHIAIDEAHKLGIPIFAIIDTNCNPNSVDYPIPANDDSVRTVELITKVIADAVLEGREYAKIHSLDITLEDKDITPSDQATEELKPRRRTRKRTQRSEAISSAESSASEGGEESQEPLSEEVVEE
ncbi:MAG: 30S ribosomal protein S2 [Bacteroidota bacterium]|nr:30S ribosomal protein S2 [Candidatus Kapabacteria bacterium]MDW8220006.1 30S ribosomal protein S2 [Bacteroidota bacterium]